MSLLNPNPANKITCSLTGLLNLKSLKFENYGLSIIQGAETLFHLLLKNFFLPVNQYQYSEFVLAASGSTMLDPGNISNVNGDVTGIIIVVEYPALDGADANVTENDKYIHYSYHDGPDMNIGKMLMLTGTGEAGAGWNLLGSPGGMLVTNPHANFDVTLKVLLIS